MTTAHAAAGEPVIFSADGGTGSPTWRSGLYKHLHGCCWPVLWWWSLLERDIEGWSANQWKALGPGYYCRKFKSPQHRSSPDRIFAKDGRAFFVEFKRTGESPTDLQLEEHAKLRAAGMTVYVCDSRKGEEKHAKHASFTAILKIENATRSWE
jgi:hypothetical protein